MAETHTRKSQMSWRHYQTSQNTAWEDKANLMQQFTGRLETEPASSKCQASSYPFDFTLFTGLAVKWHVKTRLLPTAARQAAPGMSCPPRVAIPAPLCPIAQASDVFSRLSDSLAQQEAIWKSTPKAPRHQDCVQRVLLCACQPDVPLGKCWKALRKTKGVSALLQRGQSQNQELEMLNRGWLRFTQPSPTSRGLTLARVARAVSYIHRK